jgi:hypothetical protein
MRVRWGRIAVFAAIVLAHALLWRLLPALRVTEPVASVETPLTVWMLSATHEPESPAARKPGPTAMTPQAGTKPRHRQRDSAEPQPERDRSSAPALIDWAKEAETAAADGTAEDTEATRRSAALSRWKSHVMPSPEVPRGPQFGWDRSHTQRFETTPQGLLVMLNDRCGIIVNPLGVAGGCALGHIPMRGDLFDHMRDPPPPASQAP